MWPKYSKKYLSMKIYLKYCKICGIMILREIAYYIYYLYFVIAFVTERQRSITKYSNKYYLLHFHL